MINEKYDDKRMEWLDILKGFLMIIVIWSHSTIFCKAGYIFTASYMQVFFFIMGYSLKPYQYSYKEQLYKKAKRLLIPYFFYGIFLTIIGIIMEAFLTKTITTNNIVRKIGGGLYSRYSISASINQTTMQMLDENNSILWYLTAVFIAFIWTLLFFNYSKKVKIFLVIVYYIITVGLSYLPILLPWSIDTSFAIALFMIAGYYYRKLSQKNEIKRYGNILYIGMIGLYFLSIIINRNINTSIRMYGPHGIIGIFLYFEIGMIGSILCFKGAQVFSKSSIITKILVFVGKNSISYLCLQLLFLNIGQTISFNLLKNKLKSGIFSFIFALVMCTVCAKLIIFARQKYKIANYL